MVKRAAAKRGGFEFSHIEITVLEDGGEPDVLAVYTCRPAPALPAAPVASRTARRAAPALPVDDSELAGFRL
jgi:hypothetical protein